MLSFPRDLWVTIAGRSSQQRINDAYERDNPQQADRHDLPELRHPDRPLRPGRLLCLQDVRRRGRRRHRSLRHAGAAIRPPACTFPRRAASRSTATTPSPTCGHGTSSTRRSTAYGTTDGTSDLGRISRQQDFLRRTVSRLLDEGAFDPAVASALIKTLTAVRRHRPRPHHSQDARVGRRDEQGRPDRDHDVPDRVTAHDDPGQLRADPRARGRQHADDPRRLPRRGDARRCPRPGLRTHDRRPDRRHDHRASADDTGR